MMQNNRIPTLSKRFRGLLPVVVDVETAGLNPSTDALLELGAVFLNMDEKGKLMKEEKVAFHVEPFVGSILNSEALEINRIDPHTPLRFALPEAQVLHRFFAIVRHKLEVSGCYRAVLVGQNAWFDLSFLLEASRRCQIENMPFHTFTTFDTATLAAVAFGESVLARALRKARIKFDINEAHSALYDAEKTAELFCLIANKMALS